MPAKTGLIARIVEYLRKHPGRTGAELGAALCFDHLTGTVTYARKTGAIFAAGPMHWQRYFATRAEAEAAHDDLVAQARAHVIERKRIEHRKGNLKRRAQRHAAGVKPANTRQAELASITLPQGAAIHPDVRVTVAKPIPDRFAPSPGWERAITADYFLRRQGVTG